MKKTRNVITSIAAMILAVVMTINPVWASNAQDETEAESTVTEEDQTELVTLETEDETCEHVWDDGQIIIDLDSLETDIYYKTYTCTICGETYREEIVYTLTSEEDPVITPDSDGLVITASCNNTELSSPSVIIDGSYFYGAIASSDYSEVYISTSYLYSKLDAGTHTVRVLYSWGGVSTTFTLEEGEVSDTPTSGTLWDSISWTLENGVLTISGSGDMWGSNTSEGSPWYSYRDEITNVVIEEGITNVGQWAFTYCTNLVSVSLPDSITEIAYGAFLCCENLTDITIPDGVTELGGESFEGCESLESIVIPDSVTTISNSVFSGCTSLKSVELGSGMTTIAWDMFGGCSSLESIQIPDNITQISAWAFTYCTSLKSIVIPDSVTEIYQGAFYSCTSLEEVVLPETTSISSDIFAGCTKLADEDGYIILDNIVYGYVGSETDLVIPDGVTEIAYGAFDAYYWEDYENITSIIIPDSVTVIGGYAFEYCYGLTSVSIPSGVTVIENGTFFFCTNLESIAIPESVVSIGNYAFHCCESLSNVYYAGSESDWANIEIGSDGNSYLEDVDIHYGTEGISVNISSAAITLSYTSCTYNGSARKPSVTVVVNGTTLTKGTDYTVTYKNNTNAGTATVTVTGTGDYTGTATATFTIKAKSLSSATITLSSTSYTYDGSVKKPSVKSVVLNGTTLTSSDYTVKYASGRKSIGTYKVRITGTGNYTGTTTVTFTIKPAKVTVSSVKSSAAKKLTVKWSKVSGSVTGYQIRYKKSTSSSWTTVTVKASTLSKTISSLTAGKKYSVQVRAYKTVSGKKYYGSWSSTKSVTVKKAQTLTVKSSSSKTVSYSKVKKAKQTVTAITKVSGAKGTVTYSKSSGKSYFTVNSKTGKITVKKGTPKGTYTVKIKVTSAAKGTYASASKTVTVKIKVK